MTYLSYFSYSKFIFLRDVTIVTHRPFTQASIGQKRTKFWTHKKIKEERMPI